MAVTMVMAELKQDGRPPRLAGSWLPSGRHKRHRTAGKGRALRAALGAIPGYGCEKGRAAAGKPAGAQPWLHSEMPSGFCM